MKVNNQNFIIWLDGYISAIEESPCSHVPFRYLDKIRRNLNDLKEKNESLLEEKSMVTEGLVSDLPEDEILASALGHLAEACVFFFEMESDHGIAMAFMSDSLIKYGEAILKGRDPRLSEEFYEVNLEIK